MRFDYLKYCVLQGLAVAGILGLLGTTIFEWQWWVGCFGLNWLGGTIAFPIFKKMGRL